MFCRKCGADLREGDVFCSKCGVCVASDGENVNISHEDTVLDLTTLNNPTKKSNIKLVITLCSVVGVILIAAVITVICLMSGNSADRNFESGNYEAAAEAYEELLEKDKENTEVRLKLGESLVNIGEYDEAIDVLDYIFRYSDGDEKVYELLLIACAGEKEDSLANEFYEAAQEKNVQLNLGATGYETVPDLVDMSLKKAEKAQGVDIIEKDRVDNEAQEGTIIKQTPQPGSIGRATAKGLKVYVTVSNGPGDVVMKDYRGKTLEKVKADLDDTHLIETEDEGSSTIPKGMIVRTVPDAGEIVKKNSIVTVYISTGEKIVSVPKLTGKTLEHANDLLENVELGIGSVSYVPSSKAEGTVISQNPTYRSKVNAGTYVDVTVSSGEDD